MRTIEARPLSTYNGTSQKIRTQTTSIIIPFIIITEKHRIFQAYKSQAQAEQLYIQRSAAGSLDYRRIVSTAKGLKAAAKMVMNTGLLGQFELARTLLYGEV